MIKLFVVILFIVCFIFSPPIMSQDMTAEQESFERLLKGLENDDDSVRYDSLQKLSQFGAVILPKASEILTKGKGYSGVYSARLILRIKTNDSLALNSLSATTKNEKEKEEVRRYAAYVMALEPNGISELSRMLSDKDVFVRRSSAFALLELIENGSYLPKTLIPPLFASVDSLVQALGDEDNIVRGVASESLVQVLDAEIPALSNAAKNSNSLLKETAKAVIKRRKSGDQPEGLMADAKVGFEEAIDKNPKISQGVLGVIRALRMGGEPVRDYRTKRDGDARILHMVLNPRTRKLSSRLNDFSPYDDL